MNRKIRFVQDIINRIQTLVQSNDYMSRSWLKEKFFPRPSKCKLSFEHIIYLILSASKRSLQVEINNFLLENNIPCECYSKQAFSKRRNLIKPEAIEEIFQEVTSFFYKKVNYKTYRGNVIVAIDGSKLNLPDSTDIQNYFGAQTTSGAPQNQALSSCAFDVLNGLYLDARITPCKSNERTLAASHIDYINSTYSFESVLYLLDRGYPSAELIKKLADNGSKFVFRCDKSFIKGIERACDDCTVNHKFSRLSEAMTFRIVSTKNDDNNEEILVTNLPENEYSKEELHYLYHLRWGIETSYDHAKNAICIENFSGTSSVAVQQDYYAAMYLYNMAGAMLFCDEEEFDEKHNNCANRRKYKQNLSVTIGTLKPVVTKMLLTPSKIKKDWYLYTTIVRLMSATTAIKDGRHYERDKKHKTSKFSISRRPVR